jgi:hypothetical protein
MRQPDNLPAFCRVHRNGRPLLCMGARSATIGIAKPAGRAGAAHASGGQKSGTRTRAAPGWASAG